MSTIGNKPYNGSSSSESEDRTPIQLKATSLIDQTVTSDLTGSVVLAETIQETNGITIDSGEITFSTAGFYRIQVQMNLANTNNTEIETWAESYSDETWSIIENSGNVDDMATANENNFLIESTFVVSAGFTIRVKIRTSTGSATLDYTSIDNGTGVPSVTILAYELDPTVYGITVDTANLTEPLYIGSGVNNLTIEEDGTWQNKGDSTVWDDVVNSLIGRRLYSNAGSIDYDYNENAILFSDDGDITNINDRVVFNLQYPHSAKEDGTMNLHIHWNQEDTTDIEFTVQYRIQSNGNAKTTAWTTAISSSNTNNVFTYTSGILNQITKLVDIDMTGAGISATVQFRFTRSDSNGGVIMGTFVDAHVERDMNGSREEFVK